MIKPMESLRALLPYIQIALAALLTVTILLQQSDAGLGRAFGGGDISSAFHTKRGFEKKLFIATIIIAILFILSALLAFYLKSH
jgi:protein translocase SecG subunit